MANVRVFAGSERPSGRSGGLICVTCVVFSVAVLGLHYPVLRTESLFAIVNATASALLVALGLHLAWQRQERFAGYAFVISGVTYPLAALDAYPGWGVYACWLVAFAPPFYVSIAWAVLRHGTLALHDSAERAYLWFLGLVTSTPGVIGVAVARPEWLGLPAEAEWVTLWPSRALTDVGMAVNAVGATLAALLFVAMVVRKLQRLPLVDRAYSSPIALCGAAFAAASASLDVTVATFPGAFSARRHGFIIMIGLATITFVLAVVAVSIRQRMLGVQLLTNLPRMGTAESLTAHVRRCLRDPDAELLFWVPELGNLIDAAGRPRPLDAAAPTAANRTWVHGRGGDRVALLMTSRGVPEQSTSVKALTDVLSIAADNVRLDALLRLRVAQVTAARAAESLAYDRAMDELRRNLHDGVQQTILAVRLDLDGIQECDVGGNVADALDVANGKLGTALDQIRHLKKGSAPPELRLGLPRAIEQCAAELRLPAALRISHRDAGILTVPVYYIVREALTNVHKHAAARSVTVEVMCDDSGVRIVVTDDGVGGAESGLSPGDRGLTGIRARVSELGGETELCSPHLAGTRLEVRLPRLLR